MTEKKADFSEEYREVARLVELTDVDELLSEETMTTLDRFLRSDNIILMCDALDVVRNIALTSPESVPEKLVRKMTKHDNGLVRNSARRILDIIQRKDAYGDILNSLDISSGPPTITIRPNSGWEFLAEYYPGKVEHKNGALTIHLAQASTEPPVPESPSGPETAAADLVKRTSSPVNIAVLEYLEKNGPTALDELETVIREETDATLQNIATSIANLRRFERISVSNRIVTITDEGLFHLGLPEVRLSEKLHHCLMQINDLCNARAKDNAVLLKDDVVAVLRPVIRRPSIVLANLQRNDLIFVADDGTVRVTRAGHAFLSSNNILKFIVSDEGMRILQLLRDRGPFADVPTLAAELGYSSDLAGDEVMFLASAGLCTAGPDDLELTADGADYLSRERRGKRTPGRQEAADRQLLFRMRVLESAGVSSIPKAVLISSLGLATVKGEEAISSLAASGLLTVADGTGVSLTDSGRSIEVHETRSFTRGVHFPRKGHEDTRAVIGGLKALGKSVRQMCRAIAVKKNAGGSKPAQMAAEQVAAAAKVQKTLESKLKDLLNVLARAQDGTVRSSGEQEYIVARLLLGWAPSWLVTTLQKSWGVKYESSRNTIVGLVRTAYRSLVEDKSLQPITLSASKDTIDSIMSALLSEYRKTHAGLRKEHSAAADADERKKLASRMSFVTNNLINPLEELAKSDARSATARDFVYSRFDTHTGGFNPFGHGRTLYARAVAGQLDIGVKFALRELCIRLLILQHQPALQVLRSSLSPDRSVSPPFNGRSRRDHVRQKSHPIYLNTVSAQFIIQRPMNIDQWLRDARSGRFTPRDPGTSAATGARLAASINLPQMLARAMLGTDEWSYFLGLLPKKPSDHDIRRIADFILNGHVAGDGTRHAGISDLVAAMKTEQLHRKLTETRHLIDRTRAKMNRSSDEAANARRSAVLSRAEKALQVLENEPEIHPGTPVLFHESYAGDRADADADYLGWVCLSAGDLRRMSCGATASSTLRFRVVEESHIDCDMTWNVSPEADASPPRFKIPSVHVRQAPANDGNPEVGSVDLNRPGDNAVVMGNDLDERLSLLSEDEAHIQHIEERMIKVLDEIKRVQRAYQMAISHASSSRKDELLGDYNNRRMHGVEKQLDAQGQPVQSKVRGRPVNVPRSTASVRRFSRRKPKKPAGSWEEVIIKLRHQLRGNHSRLSSLREEYVIARAIAIGRACIHHGLSELVVEDLDLPRRGRRGQLAHYLLAMGVSHSLWTLVQKWFPRLLVFPESPKYTSLRCSICHRRHKKSARQGDVLYCDCLGRPTGLDSHLNSCFNQIDNHLNRRAPASGSVRRSRRASVLSVP